MVSISKTSFSKISLKVRDKSYVIGATVYSPQEANHHTHVNVWQHLFCIISYIYYKINKSKKDINKQKKHTKTKNNIFDIKE